MESTLGQSHGLFLSITSRIVAVSFRIVFLLVCVISFNGEKMKVKQSVSVSPLPTFFVFLFLFLGRATGRLKKKGERKGDEGPADRG